MNRTGICLTLYYLVAQAGYSHLAVDRDYDRHVGDAEEDARVAAYSGYHPLVLACRSAPSLVYVGETCVDHSYPGRDANELFLRGCRKDEKLGGDQLCRACFPLGARRRCTTERCGDPQSCLPPEQANGRAPLSTTPGMKRDRSRDSASAAAFRLHGALSDDWYDWQRLSWLAHLSNFLSHPCTWHVPLPLARRTAHARKDWHSATSLLRGEIRQCCSYQDSSL